jgi:alpha-beta hydrolase superfamily lysophospholipase
VAARDELIAPTADGVLLRIDRVRPVGPRRGAVVCLHAMMTDGRYFGARAPDGGEPTFAQELAAAGLDVLVAHFRGHGRSVPPRAGSGDWSFDDLVDLDLPAIVAAAAAACECPPGALSFVGHSLGGLVASAAIGTGRIAPPRALVLAATSLWLGRAPPATGSPRHRRAIMAIYRASTALLGRAPIRALRLGTADEAATYVAQLTGWARSGRWTSLRGEDYGTALESITAPVWPVVATADWMCTPHDAIELARRVPSAAPARLVGRAHGDAIDPGHFTLFTAAALRPLWRELAAALVP